MKNKKVYEFLAKEYVELAEKVSTINKEPIPLGDFDKLFDYEKRKQSASKLKNEVYILLGRDIESDFTSQYIDRRQNEYQCSYENLLKQKSRARSLEDLIHDETNAYVYGAIIDLYNEIAVIVKEECL